MAELYERLQDTLLNGQVTIETQTIIEEFGDINYINWNKEGILHEIAINNNIALLNLLIERRKDVDLNIKTEDDSTPLMLSITFKNFDLAKILINANCNLNTKNDETALHLAVIEESVSLVQQLIKHGAEVNIQSNNGRTPLSELLCSDCTVLDSMLEILLVNGADINIPDNLLHTPLHWCIYNQSDENVRTMLDYDPNLDLQNCDEESALLGIIQKFQDKKVTLRAIELDFDLELGDGNDNKPLHYAVAINSTILAYEMIKKGADVNSQNYDGNTPLHLAECDSEMFYMLMYYGANVNVLNEEKVSPALGALITPEDDFVNLIGSSSDYLIGDGQYYSLYALLENSLQWGDNCLLCKVLENFEEFLSVSDKRFEKLPFETLFNKWKEYNFDYQICQCFAEYLNILHGIKLKNFSVNEYFSFQGYYGLLWEASEFSQVEKCERMKIVWHSLSLGIVANIDDIRDTIFAYSLDDEFYALIFGSFTQKLLKTSYNEKTFKSYDVYLKFLHCDIDSKKGKQLQNEIILHESVMHRFRMLRFLSYFNFHVNDLNVSKDVQKMKVKTLQELSRNKVRTCIKRSYRTENFYEIHEIISSMDIPRKIKEYLQLRITDNKCPVCNVEFCASVIYAKYPLTLYVYIIFKLFVFVT